MREYKYKINKEAINQFFLTYPAPPTEEQLYALHQVITVVLIKHYSAYSSDTEELESAALMAIFDRRHKYDPTFQGYGYVYTIARNEIGNYINKYSKELLVEDILPISNASVTQSHVGVPSQIHKFVKYLTGVEQFETLDISSKEAGHLLFFFFANQKQRSLAVPEFIKDNPRALEILYRIAILK